MGGEAVTFSRCVSRCACQGMQSDAAEPFAIRVGETRAFPAYEVFVNGLLVGRLGSSAPQNRVASMVRPVVFDLVGAFATEPSQIVAWSVAAFLPPLQCYGVVVIAVNLWVIFVKRQNRLIAATMMLVPVSSLLTSFFVKWVTSFAGVNLVSIAGLTTTAGLSLALGQRAWKEWRARDALESEFEAAREVQQRLVTPAADVPGFQNENAYLPATQVGGDFFYIRPENPGGLLVVVGDVSGKGLRAAMTVSAIMGALRTMPSLPPTRVLAALNRGLAGQLRGGFVTCCAARIEPDGTTTLANAGHLPPYLNGKEVNVTPAGPLGVDAGIQYGESQLKLEQAEPLTFLSDGVRHASRQGSCSALNAHGTSAGQVQPRSPPQLSSLGKKTTSA